MKVIYWIAAGLVAAVLLALGACSEKPPGCADEETRSTATALIIGEARKAVAGADDPSGIMSAFLGKSKVELSNIVDDGYVSDRKLQRCAARVKVLPPQGDGAQADVHFTMQRVLDSGDSSKFLMEMDGVGDLTILGLVTPARNFFAANAYLGAYSGTMACSGVGGAQDGPGGPFSQQVTMNVVADPSSAHPKAMLERVSRGGGAESLAGAASNDFELVGQGANTPDDRWTTRFTVKINGDSATAQGDIRGADLMIVRRCTLDLVRGKAVVAASSTPSDSAPPKGAQALPSFPGEYEGTGDSTVTATIGQAGPDGSFPVSLDTSAVGGCGGMVKGSAKPAADATITMSVERAGARCGIALTMSADGRITTKESKSCSTFHGEACSFGGATLQRTK